MAVQKFLTWANAAGNQIKEILALVVSTGSSDAGKVVATGADGRLDMTLMPTGIGASTTSAVASEALDAGAQVNIYDNAGVITARNANSTDGTKLSHGFVLSAVASGSTATIYLDGEDTGLTGLTTGSEYFLSTTSGAIATTPPSSSGNVVQSVGYAISPTTLVYKPKTPIILA